VHLDRARSTSDAEEARLKALHRLGILDTQAETRFDRLVELVMLLLDVPIALVTLVDSDRQWFKARRGLDVSETSRDVSFCSHAIAAGPDTQMVVPDALADSRFENNPLVTGEPGIRFYAGRVVSDPFGNPLGTVCAIDRQPRQLDQTQERALELLGQLVEQELARQDMAAEVRHDQLDRSLLEATLANAPVGLAILNHDRSIARCNDMFAEQAGRPAAALHGLHLVDLLHPDERDAAEKRTVTIATSRQGAGAIDRRLARPDGREMVVNVQISPLDGPERRMVVRTIDVTEQRRVLDELTKYRYFFDKSTDLVFVLGRDLSIQHVSPSVAVLLGLDPTIEAGSAELTALFRDLVLEEDRALTFSYLDDLRCGTRSTCTFTIRIADQAERDRHFEFSAVNLLDEPAINGIVLSARDVSERVVVAEDLAHRATHDSLTGLANRSLFDEALEEELGRESEDGKRFAVVYLDLDAFKEINDAFGHTVGDDVLRAVGAVLIAGVRESDLAARIGGDEFAVLLNPVTSVQRARSIAKRLQRAVTAEIERMLPDVRAIQSTHGRTPGASHGVADNRVGDTVEAICRRADAALYRQKVLKGRATIDRLHSARA
jgi:diguanylate cyclase